MMYIVAEAQSRWSDDKKCVEHLACKVVQVCRTENEANQCEFLCSQVNPDIEYIVINSHQIGEWV